MDTWKNSSDFRKKGSQLAKMAAPAAAPARVSAAAEAALKGEFGKAYDGVRLLGNVQAKLVEHFAAKGQSLQDVKDMLVVSKNQPERTERYWQKLLSADLAAPIAEESEIERFLMWLHARHLGGTLGGAGVHTNDQVKRALEVLDQHGHTVSADIRQDMEAALSRGEEGNERDQCCNALIVHILYLGRAPEAIEEAWWQEQYARLGGRLGGKVEITKSPTYQKAHAKSPDSVNTLERALKKEERFNEWCNQTLDAIINAGLPKAASMLMKVLGHATRLANGSWHRKKTYIYGYFFEEFTGLGLPADYAMRSAFNAMSAVPVPSMERVLSGTPSAIGTGSALGLGSMSSGSIIGGYDALGDSASQVSGMQGLAEIIKLSIQEGFAQLSGGGSGAGGGGGGGSDLGRCMYCHKADCPMLRGGAPCKDAKFAGDLLSKRRAEAKKAAAAAADAKKSAASE